MIELKAKDFNGSFFNPNGEPISLKEWVALTKDPHRFNKEKMVDGYLVITRWTGVDIPSYDKCKDPQFSFGRWTPNDPPQIFETLVFNPDLLLDSWDRYTKLEEAYEGHMNTIEKLKD